MQNRNAGGIGGHSGHRDFPPIPKAPRARQGFGGPATGKGMGPSKACGHKGGIRRQGSKRG